MPARSGCRAYRPVTIAGAWRALPCPAGAAIPAVISAALVGSFAAPLHAQGPPSLEARTLVESGSGPSCALGMSSDIGLHVPGARVAVVSAPVTDGFRQRIPPPLLAVDVARTFDRVWQVRAAGAVGASESRCASQSQWSRGWVQIARAIPRGGVSIGVGARSLSTLDPSRDRAGVTLALWQHRGASRFGVDVRTTTVSSPYLSRFTSTVQRPDSFPNDTAAGGWVRYWRSVDMADSAITTQRSQSIALRTSWQRRIGRTALDFSAGAIGNLLGGSGAATSDTGGNNASLRTTRIEPWARLDARVRVRSWADLLLGVAALPTLPDQRVRTSLAARTARSYSGRVFSIGVSIGAGAREPDAAAANDSGQADGADASAARVTFEARRIDSLETGGAVGDGDDDGRVAVLVRLRDPGARAVEVSGEPFGWRAIPLVRVDANWWEARVRMPSGTWRMSVRRDGRRWTAPPGFPALQDEFGGEVGLITIR